MKEFKKKKAEDILLASHGQYTSEQIFKKGDIK